MRSIMKANRPITILAAIIAAVAMLALTCARVRGADDDDKDWKVLGNAKIERKSGSAKIDVGGDDGLVKRIKFEVRGADVEFKKVTVTYESGDPEDIDVRDEVRRGGSTRAIDLKGGTRAVKKVLIAFKVDNDTDSDAVIVLRGSN
jgi:Protein of unknown function (DUF2541)